MRPLRPGRVRLRGSRVVAPTNSPAGPYLSMRHPSGFPFLGPLRMQGDRDWPGNEETRLLVRARIQALTPLCQPISFVTEPLQFLHHRPPADMRVRERTLGREGGRARKSTKCDLNDHLPTHFNLLLVKAVARAPEHDIT